MQRVHWTLDGTPVTVRSDWSSSIVAEGGFDRFSGRIPVAQARAIPTLRQGSVVRGTLDDGVVRFEGRLATIPKMFREEAYLVAEGYRAEAARRSARLPYQVADYSLWKSCDSDPHRMKSEIQGSQRFSVSTDGKLSWLVDKGVNIAQGDRLPLVLWVPGAGDARATRIAFRLNKNADNNDFDLRTCRGVGPAVSLTEDTSFSLGGSHADGDDIDDPLPTFPGQNMPGIKLRCTTAETPTANPFRVWLTKVRVNFDGTGNGRGPTADTWFGWQVIDDVARALGGDVTGIDQGAGANVLPLDWTGDWAEVAFVYVPGLEDRVCMVLEDAGAGPRWIYQAWGRTTWTVYRTDGADLDGLEPLPLYNGVNIKYQTTAGVDAETGPILADPDPLAGTGILNIYEEALADPQPDDVLATVYAGRILPHLSSQRYGGRVRVVRAYGPDGRDNPRGIMPGDYLRIGDWAAHEDYSMRVVEVEDRRGEVSVQAERPSPRRLLADDLQAARERGLGRHGGHGKGGAGKGGNHGGRGPHGGGG